ncbi:MAG: hypothetical protein AAGA96_13085 [Verrucomicrobiota bacterium]
MSESPTGFIRTEKIDGKWWFIDAEGKGFFPIGMTHSAAYYPEDPPAIMTKLADIGLSGSFVLVGGLQPEADELEYRYGKSIWPPLIEHTNQYQKPENSRPDPFSTEYDERCHAVIQRTSQSVVNNPNVLGYTYGFSPFAIMHKWINGILAKDGSPGKLAFVEEYRKIYQDDIALFNAVYGSQLDSFDELVSYREINYEKSLDPTPEDLPVDEQTGKKRDVTRLSMLLIAQTHKVPEKHIRKYDPNHLILGFALKTYAMNADLYLALAPYVDVLCPQHLHVEGHTAAPDSHYILDVKALTELTGKPIYLSDNFCGNVNPKKSRTGRYPRYTDESHIGAVFQAHVLEALAHPEVIGFSACISINHRTDQHAYKGLLDAQGFEKFEVTEHIREMKGKLIPYRNHKLSNEDLALLQENTKSKIKTAVGEE